ncbi:MAG: hypothetical protein IH852_11335 [Bacteroidetes bacterium]|nr:hypothetical protein [Bacteroidota bacterium]
MMGTSVAVIGSASIDRVVQGSKSVRQLGGVVTYASLTFQRHGIETIIVSNVADKDKSILKVLCEEGVHVFRGHTENTTNFINHIDGNNRWQEMPVNADPITDEQVRSVLGSVGHLHLGVLHPYDIEPKAIKLIDKTKIFISLDVQGYVRCIENNQVRLRVSGNLTDALLCAHMVKADEIELTSILAFYKMSLSELMRAYKIDEMVITAGPQGGLIRRLTGEEIRYDAKSIDFLVDPTGAGDVFFAAYLTYRFQRDKNISIASELAASLASQQIEGRYISKEILNLEH